MTKYSQYGKNEKKIMFADTDKRHADLKAKLRRDGLTQVEFFQNIITGYLNNDMNIVKYIFSVKQERGRVGKRKIKKCYEETKAGQSLLADMGFTEKDKDFIFDTIENTTEDE